MSHPKDAFGIPLKEGDAVELIHDVTIGKQTLPKDTVLHGLRYWLNDTQVEFDQVQAGGEGTGTNPEDRVIPTKHLKKLF